MSERSCFKYNLDQPQMRLYILLSLFVCTIVASAACGSSTSPSAPDSGVTSLQSTDVKVGTGTQATSGRLVTVNYTGWLYVPGVADHHGSQFDSSFNPGRTPYTFTLGVGSVIAGWDQGVVGMRVGGQRTLVIPPSLGYGNQAMTGIPANSTLIFDIELLDVR
jgi:FKBP-type peptidyl-prolyl cis-trans isomerase FkpA